MSGKDLEKELLWEAPHIAKEAPEQRAEVHLHEPFFEPLGDGRDVNCRVRDDHAGRLCDHALCRVEHAHDYRPGVRDDENGTGRLEHPLEKDRRLNLVEVVAVGHYLDQLQGHHNGENDASYGQDDRLGQRLYHAENVRVPALRRLAYLTAYLRDVLVDVVKETGEIRDNAAGENLFNPLGQRVFEKFYAPSPPTPRHMTRGMFLAFISRTSPRAVARASYR